MLENRMGELIKDAKQAGLTLEDMVEMMEALYKL